MASCSLLFSLGFTTTKPKSLFLNRRTITKFSPNSKCLSTKKTPTSFQTSIKSFHRDQAQPHPTKPNLSMQDLFSFATSLYPVYVTVGGVIACVKPSAFSWFVRRGPASYSFSLGFIMLAMGLTLELSDFVCLFMQRPLSILFGCIAQYSIMPSFGALIAKSMGLSPALSVGLILLSCCPGGTASNVRIFPEFVKVVVPFCPLLAVLVSSLLASSVFSENVIRLGPSILGAKQGIDSSLPSGIHNILSGELAHVMWSVLLLHFAGFFVGNLASSICRFREPERRAISIEVGMQNSALGVVLATSHFTSPLVALPSALSAVIMNVMGSSLGLIWRHVDLEVTEEDEKA
ncbi:probable sodium/metabolite cotransporter BASS2, chloroplastic isoform X4 [Amborella trichopoda]|uniref:probable sodium/metabolite cotransporter BASS2, chloroplastic isoform X4 n=1 Tax=Amborella trichopoda TaxID=13333 RepID=UPI0009C0F2C0|nr:probable sodium/metabolite cotransporter BASS2, chloroplastic isoform X4 [Amborella trichopoda]|eukprot:XP_020524535.1 probable sodium/metabolite cotransporter BASS2, chloroplastic isoform X4 [Amborella trichopoda]